MFSKQLWVGFFAFGNTTLFNRVAHRAAAVVQTLLLALVILAGTAFAARAADWLVNIDDQGVETIPAGGTVPFNIRVTNDSTTAAPATTLELIIPAQTVFVSGTGAITGCTPTPLTVTGTVTCNVPALAADASVSFIANVRFLQQGTRTIEANIPATDDNPLNNREPEPTTVQAGSELELNLTGPATAASGSLATYDFQVTNNGPDPVTSFTLTVPVPTGLGNITPPAGCNLSGPNYVCNITQTLAVGQSLTRSFTGQITAGQNSTVTVVGNVTGSTPDDPVTSNNTDTVNTTTTPGTDLTIGKARSPNGALLVGDSATFTLTPRYSGDSPEDMTIVDTVPANYTINTPIVASPGWTCTVNLQTVRCTRASGSGAGANVSLGTISIPVTASSATGGAPATNTATISSAGGPPEQNTSNNSASDTPATIDVPSVDLRANKSGPANPAIVVIGNNYNFNISTTNLGNAPFVGTVVMTDALPAGLTVDQYTLNGWSCTPAPSVSGPTDIVCQLNYTAASPLAVGANTPAVTLRTQATASGTIINRMEVSTVNPNFGDPNTSNNTVSYQVIAQGTTIAADILVNKSRTDASVAAGDVQTFNIEVVNAGPAESTDIDVRDALNNLINGSGPATTGAGLVSISTAANAATGLTCSSVNTGGTSRRLECDIASLPVCTAGVNCPVITVAVRPGGNAGTRTNTATAISNQVGDPNLGNNSGSASFDVEARADVTVTKSDSPDPVAAGQNLTYTIAAQTVADGRSAAENVTITDTLPNGLRFVSATPSTGTCSTAPAVGSVTSAGNNQVVCNLGPVNNGSQQTVQIVVRPEFATRGTTFTNSVVVSTSTPGDDPNNNTASVPTTVTPHRLALP
jgi:uncharacterized repeat protein (TIGR01451 family)